MSKEHPILFSTPMVVSVIDDLKTMTRRIMKPQISDCDHSIFVEAEWKDKPTEWVVKDGFAYCGLCGNGVTPKNDYSGIKCPYGKVGDILWVRETFRSIEQDFGEPRYEYKATEKINLIDKWKPSIFMPRIASRIKLEITDIKVERLHDITEEDCYAEGITNKKFPFKEWERLWIKINGEESWEANYWVWCISFKKI